MASPRELPRGVAPGDTLLALHDFDARGDDELTLRRGDKIELLELDEGFGDGWYLGRHISEDRTGLFPGVYTTVAPRIEVRNRSETPTAGASVRLVQSDPEGVSPMTNEDATPHPSRPASATGDQPAMDSERPRSQQSQLPMSRPPGIQRTISETMATNLNGEDSPVLSETLSVIDEHITDFSTPRQSLAAQPPRSVNDSSSEYSNHFAHRASYIQGVETDEEEERIPSEADVRLWDHKQTAQHLRDLHVEPAHCDIFEEQEITGDVLLEMDQEFIYMKDFDFGVMGRRLKTWHKIKAFQEEVNGAKLRQSTSTYSDSPEEFDRSQSRAGVASSFLPRIPSLGESNGQTPRQSRGTNFMGYSGRTTPGSVPTPPISFSRPRTRDSSFRPAPDSIRQSNYHRRYSSIDESPRSPLINEMRNTVAESPRLPVSREKKASFDKGWTMDNQQTQSQGNGEADAGDAADLDRGYFSGGELDSRRSRNLLKKRDSGGRSFSHSRQDSAADDSKMSRNKRHSKLNSTNSFRDFIPYFSSGEEAKADLHLETPPRRKEMVSDGAHSPTVTKLEEPPASSIGFLSSFSSLHLKQHGDHSNRSSHVASSNRKTATKAKRATGLRAISDAVTGNEKALVNSPSSTHSPKSPARTDSSTPSAVSKSFELEGTEDGSSKASDGNLPLVNIPKTPSNRGKTKKGTSAYTRGLEKKTPQEQMIGCDYYGWMKKKSSTLMTTWKPRLFVLRGRRLSYYYTEDDTEERGLIDISSHRVFRADQDTITSLHATITGAKSSPTSPTHSTTSSFGISSGGTSENSSASKGGSTGGSFIFKLVPPKAGLSRAVQFTKPAVHFFQVDNIQQGRLWMAALVKATIERDLNLPVKTTNKQKTITLKQARTLIQPPLGLLGIEDKESSKQGSAGDSRQESISSSDNKPTDSKTTSVGDVGKLEEADTSASFLLPESSSTTPSRSYST